MCRVFPMFIPDWLAPLFVPICRPMIFCPALSCSSVNSRLLASASLGPYAPVFLARALIPITHWWRFWASYKSTVWNISWSGTPNCFILSIANPINSICLNDIVGGVAYFFSGMDPGFTAFTNLQSLTPSLSWFWKLSMSPDVLKPSPIF